MAYNDPRPAKYRTNVNTTCLHYCSEDEADRWIIEIGWEGKECTLELPDRATAILCMNKFVLPVENGELIP